MPYPRTSSCVRFGLQWGIPVDNESNAVEVDPIVEPDMSFTELWTAWIKTNAELQSEYQIYLQGEFLTDNQAVLDQAKTDPVAQSIVNIATESFAKRVKGGVDRIIELVLRLFNIIRDMLSAYAWRGRTFSSIGEQLVESSSGMKSQKDARLIENESLIKNLQIAGKIPYNVVQEYEIFIDKLATIAGAFEADEFRDILNELVKETDRDESLASLIGGVVEVIRDLAPISKMIPRAPDGVANYCSRVMLGQRYIEATVPQRLDTVNKFRVSVVRAEHSLNQAVITPLRIEDVIALGKSLQDMGYLLRKVATGTRELNEMEAAVKKLHGRKLTQREVAIVMFFPRIFQSALTSIVGHAISVSTSISELAKSSLNAHLRAERSARY